MSDRRTAANKPSGQRGYEGHAPARRTPKGKPKAPRPAKPRKPKGFHADFPGHCIALDTIERHRDSLRRYLVTLTDTHSRFAFSLVAPTRNSQVASTVWHLAETFFPGPMNIVLTDNGGEFAKHFASLMAKEQITHWHTYPRTPKMNAHVERFNRTIQEEFVDYYDDLLFTDLALFNDKLLDWLTWYNTLRPHHSLGLRSPPHANPFPFHFFRIAVLFAWLSTFATAPVTSPTSARRPG